MSKDEPIESPFYFDKYLIEEELQDLIKNPKDLHTEFWKNRLEE